MSTEGIITWKISCKWRVVYQIQSVAVDSDSGLNLAANVVKHFTTSLQWSTDSGDSFSPPPTQYTTPGSSGGVAGLGPIWTGH
jgi:hypothetical protein